jgi:hypothetical protein
MEDMGARLEVWSGFRVERRATGVPKWIAGEMGVCGIFASFLE